MTPEWSLRRLVHLEDSLETIQVRDWVWGNSGSRNSHSLLKGLLQGFIRLVSRTNNICTDNTLRKWHWSLYWSKLGLVWEKWRVLTLIKGVCQSLQPHLTVMSFGYICLSDCFLGEILESHYANYANKSLTVKQWQVNKKWKAQSKPWRLGTGS